MRKIKFRAWDNVAKEMIYVGEDMDIVFSLSDIGIDCIDIRNGPPSDSDVDSMEHLIYMQFTGLKDKNGKEIYEGDVVQFATERKDGMKIFTSEVKFEDGAYVISEGVDYFDTCLCAMTNAKNMLEVIGNQYSNPELIKG